MDMSGTKPQPTARMLAARRQDSLQKQSAAARIINEFLLNGELISISSVAQAARVSRNFIYSHPSLLHQLEAARKTQADTGVVARQRQPTHSAPAHAALTTDLAIANHTIKRLRKDLADLRHKHQHCLGQQLELQPPNDSEEAKASEQIDHLAQKNLSLSREVAALQHRINDLIDDLAAERRAVLS